MSDYRFTNNLRPGGIRSVAQAEDRALISEAAQQADTARDQTPIEEALSQLITAQGFTFELIGALHRKLEGVIDQNAAVKVESTPGDRGPSKSALHNQVIDRIDTAATINRQLMVLLETITA